MSLKKQAWDAYWKENSSLNSFAFDYSATDGAYGAVNQFWRKTFSQFNSSDTIVDLGAGNGALANFFLQSSQPHSFKKWINIDSANAIVRVKHPKVIYQQDDMCDLSLAKNSVDHFVSMFGLEYADFSCSIPQLYECLQVGGNFHFLMHHEDAIISKQSRITLMVLEQVLASNLFSELDQFGSIENLKNHLLVGLNQHLQSVGENALDDVKIIGQAIYNIVQSSNSLSTKVNMLLSLHKDMFWQVERLQQQLAAAQQVKKLEQYLHQNGIEDYSFEPLLYKDDILGWSLTGTKV